MLWGLLNLHLFILSPEAQNKPHFLPSDAVRVIAPVLQQKVKQELSCYMYSDLEDFQSSVSTESQKLLHRFVAWVCCSVTVIPILLSLPKEITDSFCVYLCESKGMISIINPPVCFLVIQGQAKEFVFLRVTLRPSF
jgi:hypothetical protein